VHQARQAAAAGDHRACLTAAERLGQPVAGGTLESAAEDLTEHGDPERVAELAEGVDRAARHPRPRLLSPPC
jgi:hypothetical protein